MKKNKISWTGKSYGGYWGTLSFALLLRVGILPAYVLLVFVSAFFVVFRREACRGGILYLKRRFKNTGCIFFKIYKLVFSFGMSILDKISFFSGSGKIFCSDYCDSEIKNLLSEGRGLIVCTAHIGGWQIAGAQLSKYNRPVYVMGADMEDEKVSKAAAVGGASQKLEIKGDFSEPADILSAYAALKRGEITAMHIDRYAGGRFAEVNFLGGRAKVPIAAYVLAAKSGAPLLQVACIRERAFKYAIFHFKAVKIPRLRGQELEKACIAAAQTSMDNISEVLARHPYQWFNFYDFWGE